MLLCLYFVSTIILIFATTLLCLDEVVFLILTPPDYVCPFSWVLDRGVFLEFAFVWVAESIIHSISISRSSWVWFSVSLESVGAFLLLGVLLIMSFISSTLDVDYSVYWVIGSSREIGVRLVWLLMTTCVFIDSIMLFFTLTTIFS